MSDKKVRRTLPRKYDAKWVMTRCMLHYVVFGPRCKATREQLVMLFVRRRVGTVLSILTAAGVPPWMILRVEWMWRLKEQEYSDGAKAWWQRHRADTAAARKVEGTTQGKTEVSDG